MTNVIDLNDLEMLRDYALHYGREPRGIDDLQKYLDARGEFFFALERAMHKQGAEETGDLGRSTINDIYESAFGFPPRFDILNWRVPVEPGGAN